MMMQLGEYLTTSRVTAVVIFMLVSSRSSRLIPGRRAIPAVITTTSESADASYPLLPVMLASEPITGPDSSMSRALPWGRSSTTSTITTSA